MEKLIELLNEYENRDEDQQIEWRIWEWDKWENGKVRWIVNDVYMWWVSELVVCSAYYWFIKWLVENDKIDREKFWNSETKSSKYSDFELSYNIPREDYTNTLLMELAIQDEPIQFLVKILR